MTPPATPLPYMDTKPHGHADFYFAINATFRFILKRFGIDALRRYWQDMGAGYHKPVSERWLQGGLPAVAAHWRAFFAAEPGAEVEVITAPDEVRLEVRTCPMIKHLRDHQREIVSCLCQHCYYVSEAMAAPAGLTVRISGGNGACTQRFLRKTANEPGQKLDDIKEAA
ncbi:hypothetical protein [Prosthecobacter sp.]|uniref:hypothetical protein n=1 Tax=Prosthecobacter sp. TaxID=1965333 RepID=UPI0024892CF8|nr:hypothetical protein [Prosthecobacter sp.]MDI1313285.1 hypothetical protein [Prosthecobacter sp.]